MPATQKKWRSDEPKLKQLFKCLKINKKIQEKRATEGHSSHLKEFHGCAYLSLISRRKNTLQRGNNVLHKFLLISAHADISILYSC